MKILMDGYLLYCSYYFETDTIILYRNRRIGDQIKMVIAIGIDFALLSEFILSP